MPQYLIWVNIQVAAALLGRRLSQTHIPVKGSFWSEQYPLG